MGGTRRKNFHRTDEMRGKIVGERGGRDGENAGEREDGGI